jgi:hypothetical protein
MRAVRYGSEAGARTHVAPGIEMQRETHARESASRAMKRDECRCGAKAARNMAPEWRRRGLLGKHQSCQFPVHQS